MRMMMRRPPQRRKSPILLVAAFVLLTAAGVQAQPAPHQHPSESEPPQPHQHPTPAAPAPHQHPADSHPPHQHTAPASAPAAPAKKPATSHQHAPPAKKTAPKTSTATHQHDTHQPSRAAPRPAGEARHDTHSHPVMQGFLGRYDIGREASGTAWLPDATPHQGIHKVYGEWSTMWHAHFNLVYDKQGGLRGGEKTFVNGMFMGMAQRQVGEHTFGLRAMLAPDPFMGKSGYPLLLASGETADGRTHLIDRQHPHDLFMELAAIYSRALSPGTSLFLYAGLPGEPALGPPTFMHRTSGMDIPEAPITHHWLDSTHITFGVVTAGLIVNEWKIEASTFRGREPDQNRYDIEAPKLDSYSARLTWNPLRTLSMQVSWGHLRSPEQLSPLVNEDRLTASATYTQPFGDGHLWSSTAAWGRKMLRPGETLDGFLLESALIFAKTYTVFMRAERVAETELHHDIPTLEGRILSVGKLSVGAIYDIPVAQHVKLGIGALVSRYALPEELKPLYGGNPTSYMLFARMKVL